MRAVAAIALAAALTASPTAAAGPASAAATAPATPTVRITAPADGAYLTRPTARVRFAAHAADRVSCVLDDKASGDCPRGGVNYRGLDPGSHTITVVATGSRGDAAAAAISVVVPLPGDLTAWTLVFRDDFDGARLDRTKWTAQRRGGLAAPFNPSVEDAAYDPARVSVARGMLQLTLQRASKRVDGRDYPLTSGVVQTSGKFALAPPPGGAAYLRARIRVPRCAGCWPALWMLPAAGGWPPEVDVFEFFNSADPKGAAPAFNVHWGSWQQHQQTGPVAYGSHDLDYAGDWHTYELYWSQRRIEASVDGHAAPPVTAVERIPSGPQFVIINLGHHEDHALAGTHRMFVDHVRAWTFVGDSGGQSAKNH